MHKQRTVMGRRALAGLVLSAFTVTGCTQVSLLKSAVAAVVPRHPFRAYRAAKASAAGLASKIALERLRLICDKYVAKDLSYTETREFDELRAVAADAWPSLRDEWERLSVQENGAEGERRLRVIMMCWASTGEERALQLLVDYALRQRGKGDYAPAMAIERITRVSHGLTSTPGPGQTEAYWDSLARWWKSYRPNWLAKMIEWEEVEAIVAGKADSSK